MDPTGERGRLGSETKHLAILPHGSDLRAPLKRRALSFDSYAALRSDLQVPTRLCLCQGFQRLLSRSHTGIDFHQLPCLDADSAPVAHQADGPGQIRLDPLLIVANDVSATLPEGAVAK